MILQWRIVAKNILVNTGSDNGLVPIQCHAITQNRLQILFAIRQQYIFRNNVNSALNYSKIRL